VALDALGDDDPFVVIPFFVGMDIGMAIGAHDPFCSVYAEIVFGGLFLVASVALYFPDFHLALHMPGKIDYFHMATGAGIFAVNRCGEFRCAYLVGVTAETGGRINGHTLFCCRKAGKRQEH